jgi:hypothetical protein
MPLSDDYGLKTWFNSKGVTNNTTPVTIIADPGAGLPAYVLETGQISVLNRDTATAIIILTITGGTSRIIERVSLASGDKWISGGTFVISAGETLTIELAGAITTNQLTYAAAYYQVVP